MEILTVENLNFTYAGAEQETLRNVSFSVNQGEMVLLCGATGCGKTTLLRCLKPELNPFGKRTGKIIFNGGQIGYVMQNPEQQIVTDKVFHELAYGLENLNIPQKEIAWRTAEIASYFGIGSWFETSTQELSGGQKQLLNLASVMAMQPELLILDEPTAQLDPIAAAEFLMTVRKINRELGLTIIFTEHRLEEAIPHSDKMMIMQNGKISVFAEPEKAISGMQEQEELFFLMPSAVKIFLMTGKKGKCPLTVSEGRTYISTNFENEINSLPEREKISGETILDVRNIYFRYDRKGADILNGLTFSVKQGEIFCILGENGSGKSTCLKVIANLQRSYSGEIRIFGKALKQYKNNLYQNCLAFLPQDVQTVFLQETVKKELEEVGIPEENFPKAIQPLKNKHPYDLSGGEQQLVALEKILARKPKLLLLDEPTKGMDAFTKKSIIERLKLLKETGVTVIAVTHDIEFSAECADRCGMFFRGRIMGEGTPEQFFSRNHFYTTAASRMTRGYYRNAVTVEEVVTLCRKNQTKN